MPNSKKKVEPFLVPDWFTELDEQSRTSMLSFVWAIEKANIDWTKEFLYEFMQRHNLNPTQAEQVISLFCATVPSDDEPRCVACNRGSETGLSTRGRAWAAGPDNG